jgi:hypothetical protein
MIKIDWPAYLLNIELSASNFLISSGDVELFTHSVFAGIGQQGVIEGSSYRTRRDEFVQQLLELRIVLPYCLRCPFVVGNHQVWMNC